MPRITADDCTLLIIAMQDGVLPHVGDGAALLATAERLASAALALNVPVVASEHCPVNMGPTARGLRDLLAPALPLPKTSFNACAEPGFLAHVATPAVVVAGCEAHVCVLQTVLGLIEAGRRVHVVADGVAARSPGNLDCALRRMAAHGADIVTAEMVIFEWLGDALRPDQGTVLSVVR